MFFKIKMFVLLLMTCFFCSAMTLKGGVEYTIEDARKLAFENVLKQIDINQYKDYFIDPDFVENQLLLSKNKYRAKNRYLAKFLNNEYGVHYKKKPNESFYYRSNGHLDRVEIITNSKYPKISGMYNLKGDLERVSITVKYSHSFLFDINETLLFYWIKKNCYNNKGELINTREY